MVEEKSWQINKYILIPAQSKGKFQKINPVNSQPKNDPFTEVLNSEEFSFGICIAKEAASK